MEASAITISSYSSDESVGSPPSRVNLFGDIPTVIPSTSVVDLETSIIVLVISSAAPMVETTLVASPTGLCGLVPYTGSDSDSPDEMSSPEYISQLPAILPFLCTDFSKAPDSSNGPSSQDPYVATVARWRSRVTARPSSSYEFPFGRPYRTHLNGPQKLLTARKRVGPLPAHRLASRHASPCSISSILNSTSSSSILRQFILRVWMHQIRLILDLRLCYPPRRAPRRSEAFRRWCVAPLSTLYPPTTSESSSGDSLERPMHLSSHSAGPSRKRCRSPVNSVPLSTPVTGSLAPTRADLLPPLKDSFDSSGTRDGIVRSFEDMPIDLDDVVRDFYHHMSEVRIDRIVNIETAQRRDRVSSLRLHMSLSQEEFRQIRRDRDDARGRLRRLESYLERRFGFRP
ncbi:hypothetical protein Tco_0364455 [Tanacetum coccineum]